MPTTRGRFVGPNEVIFDQADLFQSDGYTRASGVTVSAITLHLYYNNSLTNWTLADGSVISDAGVVSGRVYWSPLSGGPYSIRWRPNAIGYWRLVINYPTSSQILAQDYDVVDLSSGAGGFLATFVR